MYRGEDLENQQGTSSSGSFVNALRIQNFVFFLANCVFVFIILPSATNEEKYGGEACFALRYAAVAFLEICIGFAIMDLILLCSLFTCGNSGKLHGFCILFMYFQAAVFLLLLLVVTIVLFMGEPCAELKNVMIQLVIGMYLGIILVICLRILKKEG